MCRPGHLGPVIAILLLSAALPQVWSGGASAAMAQGDNEQPVVSCTIRNGSAISGNVVITGRAFDIDGEIELVEVRIDEGKWKKAEGTGSWRFTWNTAGVALGWHTISVRSYDGEDHSEVLAIQVVLEEPDEGIDKFAGLMRALAVAGSALGVAAVLLYLNRGRIRAFGEARLSASPGIAALAGTGRGKTTQAYGEVHPVRRCETCGRSKFFYTQYGRYYCNGCGQWR